MSEPIPIETPSKKHRHHPHRSHNDIYDAESPALQASSSSSSSSLTRTPLACSQATPRLHHSYSPKREESTSDEDFDNFDLAATPSKVKKLKKKHMESETQAPEDPISCSAPVGVDPSVLMAAMATPKKQTSQNDFECIKLLGKGDVGRVYVLLIWFKQ